MASNRAGDGLPERMASEHSRTARDGVRQVPRAPREAPPAEPAASLAAAKAPRHEADSETVSLDALPFEAALEELERIAQALEDGQLALDAALALYERGVHLTKHCQDLLDGAELRVERLRHASAQDAPRSADGGVTDLFAGGAGSPYLLDSFEEDEV